MSTLIAKEYNKVLNEMYGSVVKLLGLKTMSVNGRRDLFASSFKVFLIQWNCANENKRSSL